MKTKEITLFVNEKMILRDYLKENLSKKLYKRLRNFATIYVNDLECERHLEVKEGDVVKIVYLVNDTISWPLVCKVPKIIHETDDYLIVYKEKNLLTIPTKAKPISLFQQLLYYYKITNQENNNISFVNRLDYETQGLILVAKNRKAAYYYNSNKDNITRKYYALCCGEIKEKSGVIKTYIDSDGHKRFVSDKGKIAITNYEVVKYENGYSLLYIKLDTGRTHQIRVHMNYLNAPILGDPLYGNEYNETMHLCSSYIKIRDFKTLEELEFVIKPEWM